jgi:hypothetical protein
MSSPAGFFDVLYLGVFIILSPTLDRRFYETNPPPPTLVEEIAYAVAMFNSLLNVFSRRFVIVLEGEPIAHSYLVDRMLGEFAAAVVVYAMNLRITLDDDNEEPIQYSSVVEKINNILEISYPSVLPYFLQCVDRGHKNFLWTGPGLEIFPRSEPITSVMPLLTLGERLDLPGHTIYPSPAITVIPSPGFMAISSHLPTDKRHVRGNSSDSEDYKPRKRRR